MQVRHEPEAAAIRRVEQDGDWTRRDRRDRDDRSVGHLVGDLTTEVAHLARVEAQLAAREVTEKAKRGAKGGGMFAAAGVFALYGGAAFALAAGIALALVWPAWLAALAVGVVLFAIAGIAALSGRSMIKRAMPPVPDETMERAREDARALRGGMDR
ncbi:Putative Holin-X, holin superfamily III [Glycomyces sambucus]|uniref:Putative Holin-X, holin superfamily III n=1 Tax=Glycomyces sambucus TaxID=380244 RepID=A0A1G9DM62_9ACTN|nr:phage holin family protein [Glycomyces sambucus]SDK64845.1 Putative Holin-X, holin superfamily III [Glycomyces sambucus]